jgi:Type II CAAX prenyl endopeptidase Rce1-like
VNIKLFFAVWFAALPGVLVTAWLVLPILIADKPLPMPLWMVQLASAAQSAVLLALAAAVGAALASKVNLAAPALSALLEGKPVLEAFRPQLLPGAIGGVVGAVTIWLFASFAPDALAQVQAKYAMPAIARLLYGGVTEEVLIRWGLMTLLVWLFWRVGQGGVGHPSTLVIYASIGLSALVFGLGHLPAVSAMVGQLTPSLAVYVVAGNTVFGLVAGWLYWRYGLESAILAHTLAHAIVLLTPK